MSTLYTRIGLHVSIALTLLSLCTVFAEGNKPDAPEEPASIEALAQEGRWEEVLAAAVRGLRDSPTDPRLLLWQVRAHRMRGRLARALTLCEKALAATHPGAVHRTSPGPRTHGGMAEMPPSG